MKINKNLYPPGGYLFYEKDGTQISASDWKTLFSKIAEYRTRLGRPVENVQQDVADQFCSSYPAYCHTPMSPQDREKVMKAPSLKSRVLRWLGAKVQEHRKRPVLFVSAQEVSERESICRNCPKQTALRTSCATCLIALKEFRRELLGQRSAVSSLGVCSVLAIDLQSAPHLDETTIAHPELPENCWRKKKI
jgi:hypothetical protein